MKTPLFRDGQSSKLAEGPRRVLDRERRPTANFGRVESGIGELANSMKGPRLSDELAAPWQAVARAGQDIERVGGILEGVQIKRDQAMTDFHVAEADTVMQEALAEQRAWQVNNPDPSGWESRWKEKLNDLGSSLSSNESYSERTKGAVALRFERFRGSSLADVSLSGTKQAFGLAASSGKAAVMRAIQDQDAGSFEAEVSRMEQAGYVYPHEAEGMKIQFQKEGERQTREAEQEAFQSDREAFATWLEADPWAALEATDDEYLLGSFDPIQRRAAKAEAEREIQKQQAIGMEAVRSGIITGVTDEKEIAAQGWALRLGAEEVEGLKDFRKAVLEKQANAGPQDIEKLVTLEADLRAFDPTGMDKKQAIQEWGKLYERIAIDAAGDDGRGGQTRGALYSLAYQKNPILERRPKTAGGGTLKSQLGDFIRLDEQAGGFGKIKNDDGEIDRAAGQRAINEKIEIEKRFEATLEADPKAFEMPGSLGKWYNDVRGKSAMGNRVEGWYGNRPTNALFPLDIPPALDSSNPEDPGRKKAAELDPEIQKYLDFNQ